MFIIRGLIRGLVISALIWAVIWAVVWSGAMAVLADPDDLTINDVQVYRHLIEDDDFLVVVKYDIEYASIPTVNTANAWLVRLMNGSTQLGVNVPFPSSNDSGYNEGIASIYFSAATAPTWGSAYTLRLEGSPLQYTTIDAANNTLRIWTLAAGDYDTSTTQATAQSVLATYLVNALEALEPSWGKDLVANNALGKVFTTTGESYALGAIPGSNRMAPKAFPVQTVQPAVTPIATATGTPYSTQIQDQFGASTITGSGIQALADWAGTGKDIVATMVTFLLYVGMVAVTHMKFGNGSIGLIIGSPLLFLGLWLGMPMAALFVLIFLMALYVGWMFVGRSG